MDRATAKAMVGLLQRRHSKDIMFTELSCGQELSRFDAWVISGGWSHGKRAIGYEIKVNRADFLQDQKWPAYLPYCHLFYWVAPYGMIDPAEVPDGTGLILAAKTGTRLYTKVKAPYREIEIPTDMWIRALMRLNHDYEFSTRFRPTFQEWQDFARGRAISEKVGRKVRARIRQLADESTAEIRAENQRLQIDAIRIDRIRNDLVRAGLITVEGEITERFKFFRHGTMISSRDLRELSGIAQRILEIQAAVEESND